MTSRYFRHESHHWEDVSYHGSPFYQCEYCRIMEWDEKAKEPCPKREEALKRKAEEKERKERLEWEELKRTVARHRYLIEKFGPLE